ncbi:hypothetical protein BDR03DRAFT_976385, partial [Suillus americanus]
AVPTKSRISYSICVTVLFSVRIIFCKCFKACYNLFCLRMLTRCRTKLIIYLLSGIRYIFTVRAQ